MAMTTRDRLAVLSLLFLGVAVRCVPLAMSDLPYNIDGFPLVRLAEKLIETGHWHIDGSRLVAYNAKMPGFSILLSIFSLVSGNTPLSTVQVLVPFLAATAISSVYLIVSKVTANRPVALVSGGFIALNGFYVYLTCAAMKGALGLTLIPLIYYLWHDRSAPKKRVLATGLLFMMPLLHHLSMLILLTIITIYTMVAQFEHKSTSMRHTHKLMLDLGTIAAATLLTGLYYHSVRLRQFGELANLNDVVLFISVLAVTILLTLVFTAQRNRMLMPYMMLIIGFGALLLALNHDKPVFQGTVLTSSTLLKLAIPYFMLIPLMMFGAELITTKLTPYRIFLVAWIAGPLAMISFALLRGLDLESFQIVYRAFDFMDHSLAAFVGVGAGLLFTKFRHFKVLFAVSLIVLCSATLPLAYNGELLFGVQDVTADYEFDALSFTGSEPICTDQRLADIANGYFESEADRTLPIKMRYDRSLTGLLVLEADWQSQGAQMYPTGRMVIARDGFDALLHENDVIYVSGTDAHQLYIVKV